MLARFRPSPALVIACAALIVALGGVAVASIPSPTGVIKGCYSKTTGALRVIDSAASCPSGQHVLSWNQRGLPGSSASSMLTGSTASQIPSLGPNQGEFAEIAPSGVSTPGTGSFQLSPDAPVVFRDLSVRVDTAPSANTALIFEVAFDDSPSTLTCTIPAGQTTCTNDKATETVPANSVITLSVGNTGTVASTPTNAKWGFRATQ